MEEEEVEWRRNGEEGGEDRTRRKIGHNLIRGLF